MDLMAAHPYITIILALIFWEVAKQIINYFFNKATKDDYLTKDDCEKCHKEQDECIKYIEICLSEIRQILMEVAVKTGIDPKELKNLTKI